MHIFVLFLMAMRKERYIGFNPETTAEYFANRGWPVAFIPESEVSLVKVTRGAALECGDGRFDQLTERKAHGIRVFGGIDAVMALHTGGNEIGLRRAISLIKRAGYGATPGTHSADDGGCGFADLWIAGELESARYPYEFEIPHADQGKGEWLGNLMRGHKGKHFILNGRHREEKVRLNPFVGWTELANDGSRFRIDDWFMARIGIPDRVRFFKIAETVEKLRKDAAKLEIIVPNRSPVLEFRRAQRRMQRNAA